MIELTTMNINIEELKKSPTMWIASVGKLDRNDPRWIDFLLPTETNITKIDHGDYCFDPGNNNMVSIDLEHWKHTLKYKINMNGFLEPKYHQIIGLKEEDVFPAWFFNLKHLLSDKWSGQNAFKSCEVLKQHLRDNEYGYFSKKYPELLV